MEALGEALEIGSLPWRAAALHGPRTALIDVERRWTFAQLEAMVSAAAQRIAAGVQPGDRVVVFAQNSAEAVVAMLATMATGAVVVPVQPDTPRSRMHVILNDCAPALVICDIARQTVLSAWSGLVRTIDDITAPSSQTPREPSRQIHPDDAAVILYTSGSTRTPRGVVCSHRQMAFCVSTINNVLMHSPDDVIFSSRPLSFVYGFQQVLFCLAAGATLIISPDPSVSAGLLQTLIKERVTGLPLVPSVIGALLHSRALERMTMPSLRYVTSTGDTLPPGHIHALRTALPGVALLPMYGLTECGRVSAMPPHMLEGRERSVGLPLPGTSVRIVKDGRAAAPGETGELYVRGPHLALGYWRDSELSRARFAVDPASGARELRTGDLFTTDADGFLYFISRAETIIKSYGEYVSPCEIESVISEFPGVAETAVVGVPSDAAGEIVVAFVVSSCAGLDVSSLRRHCAQYLTTAARPTRFIVNADLLPRTGHGKIDRQQLRRSAL